MQQLENKWKAYWEERTRGNQYYYGKHGANADFFLSKMSISKKDSVLDIGCANGALLTDIQNKTHAQCYGIDISPIAIKLNKNKKIHLKVGDMEKIPFSDAFFTKLISLGTIEHSPNSEKILKEFNRVLKVGGKAYVTVPNKISFFHLTKNIKMVLGKWDLGYEKSFSIYNIRKLAKQTGFELESYWVEPHINPANLFNRIDNVLNKINSHYFGFFFHLIFRKIGEADD